MSIVRVGLSENQQFADGYDAIFGNKKKTAQESDKPKTAQAKASSPKSKKKTPAKKK